GVVAGGAGGFEGVVEEVGLAEEVEFDFGFGAGWSGGDLDADGLCWVGVIDEQVAAGAGDGWEWGIGGQCGAGTGAVVGDFAEDDVTDGVGRLFAECLHESVDLSFSGGTFAVDGDLAFAVIAAAAVEVIELILECASGGAEFGGEFEDEQGADGGVFIAAVVTGEEADGFFGTEDEVLGALVFDDLGDVFEANEEFVEAAGAVECGDFACERGGDEGFDDVVIGAEAALGFAFAEEVVGEECADLIAAEGLELAIAIAVHDTEAIGIGIGGEDEFGGVFGFVDPADDGVEYGEVFGVGEMLWDVREVSIGCAMGFEDIDGGVAGSFEDGVDGSFADAVEGSEDSGDGAGSGDGEGGDFGGVGGIEFGADEGDGAEFEGLVEVSGGDFVGAFDFADDAFVVGRDDLSAVAPVGFEAIVGGGIV
ncbi:MAG: hypothetical protein RLZZ458_3092, partial [Planctomycetota bacterium]